MPFFLVIFAIIVPLGDLIFSGILESLISEIGGGETLNDKTIRIVALTVSVVLYFTVFRFLNKLEIVDEKNSAESEGV